MIAKDLLTKLIERKDLNWEEATCLAEVLFDKKCTSVLTASLLTALKMKVETVDEILAFVMFLKKRMIQINYDDLLIDTCGTGGDGQNTFNISTATSLVVAGAGIKVSKHGNRSAGGKSGSADVLEALGVDINLTSDGVIKCLEKTNIAFIFAPLFHPLMQLVGPVRKELKFRTIFNLIGPLLNPLSVKRQIIGVASQEIAEKLSIVVQKLDYDQVWIVSSSDGMDEISIYDKTAVYEISKGKINKFIINPDDFNLRGKNKNDISGDTIEISKNKLLKVLQGQKGDCRKIVLMNSAAALYISGKYKSIKEGLRAAIDSIDSGNSFVALNKLIMVSNSVGN